jgi:Domain of unknown function (DUF1843)
MVETAQHSVPPYGPAIHQAIAKGDLSHMKQVAAQAEEHLKEAGDVTLALEMLKVEIARLEHKSKS